MPYTQQLSLWDRMTRRHRPKVAPSPSPTATPAREIPLTEKTLPAMGALVRVLGSGAKGQRYHVVGVMLCGDVCRVLLRKEGVTDGPMAQAVAEALTLV